MPDITREGDERAVRERSPPTAATVESVAERAKVREVAGVLPSRAALDAWTSHVRSIVEGGAAVTNIVILPHTA